jgi:hypothetical protein
MTNTKLNVALELAGKDEFRVFPIPAGQKAPPIKGWQEWATRDAAKIQNYWNIAPQDNIGIACGDGLLVLDVDGDKGARSLAALEAP